jgi:predicted outer membrane repeat protein
LAADYYLKWLKKPQKEGIPFLNPPENASLYFKTNSSLSGAAVYCTD